MGIKRISVVNFKSFKELDIELGNFNVLIGANASGKSNFVQIFKFLKDVLNFGLDNAVSMQGGVEYFRNITLGDSENFSLEVVCDEEFEFPPVEFLGFKFPAIEAKKSTGMKIYNTTYKLALNFPKKGKGFEIVKDSVKLKGRPLVLGGEGEKIEGEIVIFSTNEGIKISGSLFTPEGTLRSIEEIISLKLPPNLLLPQIFFLFVPTLIEIFTKISIYDFDPKLPKKATPITGKSELEEDGSNLSLILKNIIENQDDRRKLFNLVKDLLPFISNLDVEKFADKSLLFKLQEIYYNSHYLPASLISDGTINITALIVALYFEKKRLIIIEEPERNIHPHLISKVVNMMKDASRNKQIIVTTHNPEIVKYAGLENLLLVSRDKNGFSTIIRPAEKEEIKTFLKNEIGIEELYVQNLIG